MAANLKQTAIDALGPPSPAEALEAEATAPDGNAAVEIDGAMLHVLPVRQWRSSAVAALRSGDFEVWAEKCIVPEDFPLWQEIDPTMDMVEEFFAAWSKVTGESLGNSSASTRSLRSSARQSKRT